MLGAALALLPDEKAAPLRHVLDCLGHVTIAIIELVMKVAPIGVFCLIFSVTARFGLNLLVNLLQVRAHGHRQPGVLPVRRLRRWSSPLVARYQPLEFFRKIRLVMITAFTTSSSNATLPTTMRVARGEAGDSPGDLRPSCCRSARP